MKTKRLLRALKLASPALHARDFVPILTHFCFAGDQLYAFDDRTAIIVFEDTSLNCAVPGKTLLELLSDASEEVEVSKTDTHLVIKDGKHELTIPVMPEDAFMFEVPEAVSKVEFELTKDTIKAIDFVSQGANLESMRPELVGVTFKIDGGLTLYSTDDVTCTRAKVETNLKKKSKAQFILPRISSELIGKIYRDLGDDLEKATFGVTEAMDYVIVQYAVSDDSFPVVLVCRTVMVDKFAEYEKFFKDFEGAQGELCDVPSELPLALKRCVTVTSGDQTPSAYLDARKKGQVRVLCTGGRGKVESSLSWKSGVGFNVKCDPARAMRALDCCSSLSVHEKGLSLKGEGEGFEIDYIVSPIVEDAK